MVQWKGLKVSFLQVTSKETKLGCGYHGLEIMDGSNVVAAVWYRSVQSPVTFGCCDHLYVNSGVRPAYSGGALILVLLPSLGCMLYPQTLVGSLKGRVISSVL